MVTNPGCGQPLTRPYLEYEGTAGLGGPLPISALPTAKFPLTGTEIIPLVQAGFTVKAPLGSILQSVAVSIVVTAGTLALPANSAYLRIVNSGGALSITPNAFTAEGSILSLKDWGQNAGTFNWQFIGTLDGVVNPVINTVNGGLCTLIYSSQGGWGMSP